MRLLVKDKSFDFGGKRYYPNEIIEVNEVNDLSQAIAWGKLKVIPDEAKAFRERVDSGVDQPVVKSKKEKYVKSKGGW